MKDALKGLLILLLIYGIVIYGFGFENDLIFDTEISDSENYAKITDVEYKAEIIDEPSGGGKALITEKITYDIQAKNQDELIWELWRDLPEDKIDGLPVNYEVISVKQILDNEKIIEYVESDKLYWNDSDYTDEPYGPGKWYHSKGPYDGNYNFECVLFYVNGIYDDTLTFEIQYIMNNAAFKYTDVSELYLSMYTDTGVENLKSFKGQVLIPNKDMPNKENYIFSTYGTNSHRFKFNESDTMNNGYHTFYFDLDEKDLKFNNDNKFLEFTMLTFNEDKHSFTNYAPNNIYSDTPYLEEALENIKEYDQIIEDAKSVKKTIFITMSLSSLIIIIYSITKKIILKKKYTFYTPTVKIDYFRDIPNNLDPYFVSKLVFSRENKEIDMGDIFSSLLLSISRKGYIEIKQIDPTKKWKQENIEINVLYTPTNIHQILLNNTNQTNIDKSMIDTSSVNKNDKKLEQLTENEKEYFNLILKYAVNSKLPMETFQNKISKDYDNTDAFITKLNKSIEEIGMKNNLFQIPKYKELKKQVSNVATIILILGLIVCAFGNLITYNTYIGNAYYAFYIFAISCIFSSIYLYSISKNLILFTQNGENEYAIWRGLYNFLNSATLMNEKTITDVALWEKYLVYATAFGISEKVCSALEIICPNILPTQSIVLSNSYYRSRSFRTYNHSFAKRTTSASHTSRSGRYSGGGYYGGGGSFYGGGGRGGGGGGGGH